MVGLSTEEEEEEEDGEIGVLAVLRLLSGIELLQDQVMCLKRLITAAFGSFEQFCMLRLMGVSAPSLHRESTDSLIIIRYFLPSYLNCSNSFIKK